MKIVRPRLQRTSWLHTSPDKYVTRGPKVTTTAKLEKHLGDEAFVTLCVFAYLPKGVGR